MTIATQNRVAGPFVGNGTQTVFPFTYKVFEPSDVRVTRRHTSSGTETVLVLGADYTVQLNPNQNHAPGGTVTTASPLPTGYTLLIASNVPALQPIDIQNQGGFYAEIVEDGLDRATILVQQIAAQADRYLRVTLGSPAQAPILAAPGEYLVFDAGGQLITTPGTGADATLRTDLAAATGAGLVGVAGGRPLSTRLLEFRNVTDYGASTSWTIDSSIALASAEASLGFFGGTLRFPTGEYRVTDHDSDNIAWRIAKPARVSGSGFYTSLRRADAPNAPGGTIGLRPDPAADHTFTTIEALNIGNYNDGSRNGMVGISVLTGPGASLPKLEIRQVAIQECPDPGSWGMVLSNDIANPNGGTYCSYIHDNAIKGGTILNTVGDSMVFARNICTGKRVGYDINLVAGATGPFLYDENITNTGGSIRVRRAYRCAIVNPNFELKSGGNASGNGNSLVYFENSNATGLGGFMLGGFLAIETGAVASNVFRINDHAGFTLFGSTLAAGVAGVTGILIESTATGTRVFGQNYGNGIVSAGTLVDDRGVGTMGVLQTIAPQSGTDTYTSTGKPRFKNGWVKHSSTEDPSYIKCPATGAVTFFGDLAGGTITDGTELFTLPVGFRPPGTSITRVVDTFDGTTWSKAVITIGGTAGPNPGRVTVSGARASRLCLSGLTFMPPFGAHVPTAE